MSEIDERITKWERAIEDIVIDISRLRTVDGIRFNTATQEMRIVEATVRSFNEIRKIVSTHNKGEYVLHVPGHIKSED